MSKAKPDPEIYATAVQRLRLDPSEVMVVEDNHNGIEAATAAGTNVMKVDTVYDVNYENIMQHVQMFEEKAR